MVFDLLICMHALIAVEGRSSEGKKGEGIMEWVALEQVAGLELLGFKRRGYVNEGYEGGSMVWVSLMPSTADVVYGSFEDCSWREPLLRMLLVLLLVLVVGRLIDLYSVGLL
ncbi:hypothetical protein Dimus_021209, partial [Dionaea muscipula]